MTDDLDPKIVDWPYRPGKISARKIIGDDGQPKIQMRVDLGLIQMEPTGRPDGHRPSDYESLLESHLDKLDGHKRDHGTDLGFEISKAACRELREEGLMYYHRYLACFVLRDYDQVIRDTQRNLQVFDLCNKYAVKKADRMMLEPNRPYVLMMNTRAKAQLSAKQGKHSEAIKQIKAGLRAIRKIYDDLDQPEDFTDSYEARILRRLGRKMRKQLPTTPLQQLKKQLKRAIDEERFEEAAKLRDRIRRAGVQKPQKTNQEDEIEPEKDR